MWLLNIWLLVGDRLPRAQSTENPAVINRVIEVHQLFGKTPTLAAISFTAFLVGSLVTFRMMHFSLVQFVFMKRLPSVYQILKHFQSMPDTNELREYVKEAAEKFEAGESDLHESRLGRIINVDDLRARLLVANQEMYGEYDRLAAEASFRVNIVPPMVALGIIMSSVSPWWTAGLLAAATITAIQGMRRQRLSGNVLIQAVLSGVVEHPMVAKLRLTHEELTRKNSIG